MSLVSRQQQSSTLIEEMAKADSNPYGGAFTPAYWVPSVSRWSRVIRLGSPTIEVLLFFWGKSIFYTPLVVLKHSKLLPPHFTCLSRQSRHSIGRSLRTRIYVCVRARQLINTWSVSSPGSQQWCTWVDVAAAVTLWPYSKLTQP